MSTQNFLKSLKFCRQAPRLMILYFLEDVSAFLYFFIFFYTFYAFAQVFFDFSICYSRRPPEFLWFSWNLEKYECLKDSILFLYFVWQVQHIRTRPPPTTSRIPRIWVEFPRVRMSYRFYTFLYFVWQVQHIRTRPPPTRAESRESRVEIRDSRVERGERGVERVESRE